MPLTLPNPTDLINRCAAAMSSDYDNCGAITACQLSVLTPDQVNSIFMSNAAGTGPGTGAVDDRFRVLNEVFTADFEGRMVGVKPNGFYDFLMSQTKILPGRKVSVTEIAPGYWEISPYVKMKRKRAITEDYWKVNLKTAATDWNIGTIKDLEISAMIPDQWRTTPTSSIGKLLPEANYFPVGQRLFISGETGTGTAGVYRMALEVTESPASVLIPAAGAICIKAKVTGVDWGAAAAGDPIAPGTSPAIPPITADAVVGLLFRGTPNVSDYEKWCSEIPKINNNEMLPFWIETTRYSLCQDEMLEAYINALVKNNAYYREWIHVDSVAHNRRVVEDFQRRHVYTIFFNQKRPNQTLADYQKASPSGLDRITVAAPSKYAGVTNTSTTTTVPVFNASGFIDPASGLGRCIGYKANAEGIYFQLAECGRVIDMKGGDIDLYKFLNTLYVLQRTRKAAGVPSEIIEVVTDSRTAFKAGYALGTYFGAQVNAAATMYHTAAGATPDWFKMVANINSSKPCDTPFGFKCMTFQLDWPVCELRLAYNDALDDVLSAFHTVAMTKAGRFLWLVDWSSIYVGIVDTNSVTNKTGTLQEIAKVDDSYMCVMRVPTRTQRLISTTYTVIVEDETTSLVFENIGDNIFAKTVGTRAEALDTAYIKL
jgi:hypothetical protein